MAAPAVGKLSGQVGQLFTSGLTYLNADISQTFVKTGQGLSIKVVILILLSDTLFGDDLFCISYDHPNRETAMLFCHKQTTSKTTIELTEIFRCASFSMSHFVSQSVGHSFSSSVAVSSSHQRSSAIIGGQSGQSGHSLHLSIWTNIFCNLYRYILRFGQIHSKILTNIFCNLNKYIVKFWQIHCEIFTNIFGNMEKQILQFWQIFVEIWTNNFVNWTNTFCYVDKYGCQFRQANLAIWTHTFCNVD